MSIFQGSEDLQLDESFQNLEEDEAEEDQKRRNKELHDLLTNAFDDLMDDDDDISTLNSTCRSPAMIEGDTGRPANMQHQPLPNDLKKDIGGESSDFRVAIVSPQVSDHYQYCFRNSPYEDSNQQYRKAEYGSMEQLEVLYEVRVREVQRLSQQLEELKEQAAHEKDQLYRRFALAQAEKEHVTQQHSQSAKNLVLSKEKVLELEKEVDTLRLNLANVQQSNLKLTGELDAGRMSVKDLEQKVSLLERSSVASKDTLLRGMQERYEKEILTLRNQIESITAKLSAKDIECEGLQQRLTDLSRTHEALLVEKTDTINQLMANLEESQRQCQKLIANIDNGKTAAEKEQLEKDVQKLQTELNTVRSDLQHYEVLAQSGLLGAEDSDSFRMDSKPQPSNDENIRLRDQLQRCLAGLCMKREQIMKLKAQLLDRDKVIKKMREQEAAYLVQTDNFKKDAEGLLEQLHKYRTAEGSSKDMLKLQSQVAELQSELTVVKADRYRLEGELVILRQASMGEKLRAIDQHSKEYIEWHDKAIARVRQEGNEQIEMLNADFSIQLREAQKECDEVKQLYIEMCNTKECEQKAKKELANLLDLQTEQLKKTQVELETERKKLAELSAVQESVAEVENLKQALNTEKEKVRSLEVDLEAARERDHRYTATVTEEIERAKMEALQELQLSSKTHPAIVDRACSPVREFKAEGEELSRAVATLEAQHHRQLEQVKQESVRCLANELATCEARHQQQLEQAEEQYSHNLATFRGLIDNKTQEVEVLKQAMLAERDKLRAKHESGHVMEELTARTKEVEQLKDQLDSYDKEWQARLSAETSKWQARLAEHQQDVESERDRMAEAIAGWAEELQTVRKQHQELEIKSLELQNKYQAAKKTARRYKLWADGKERHIQQEWQRITVGFQNAFEVLHAKAEAALTSTESDNCDVKRLEKQIQELQDKLVIAHPTESS
ncbi:centrosomal protein of 152 kDa-like isoform X2 [Zootermopsis nevadensis]|uniref:centrosomal protein of 152 kDa-like isoform X2 n=1 Tax=Zootermopsis nevadensis TaxID=136037 RepID=UPI000B8EE3B9|nr:centrosomal protein of 152 kDa-like isoform X2 [Zootermopsis nevadensis]